MSRVLSPLASSTTAMARRTNQAGAEDDSLAPTYTPGRLPIRMDVVRPSLKSPNSTCASAADPTSGTACTRSVPTRSPALSVG